MKTFLAVALCLLIPAANFAQDYDAILTKLDPRVYPMGSDEAKAAPQLFGKFLKTQRDRVNGDDVKSWNDLVAKNSKEEWEKFRDKRLRAMKTALGSFPALEAKDILVHVAKSLPGDGFVIDNIVYESRPGLWVTANLYRPEPLPKSAPGIVIIHAHHNPKTQGELQDMGMNWARAGCYVLIPDQLGHGERRQHPFENDKSYQGPFKVGRQDYYFRYNLGVQLHLVGESLIGWMANDNIAGVSVLLKKPNIDPARIIIMGSVAGGGDPSAVTAALDKRITCLVPFNFGGPQPETKFPLPADAETWFNYMGGGGWESTRNLADSAAGGFLPWVIVSSIAPRHLIHAHEFAWDGERDPVWKRYQQIWKWYGADDKIGVAHGKGSLQGKYPESTHCNNIGPEHRSMIYPHLKKWFGIPTPSPEYKNRVMGSELICWTPELKAKLKPKTVAELATEICEQGPDSAICFCEYQARSKLNEKKDGVIVRSEKSDDAGGITARRVVLEGKTHGLQTPLLILEPAKKTGKYVIAVTPRGKQLLLTERRAEIAGLLRDGIAVCLPDLPNTGEAGYPGESRGRTSGATSVSSSVRMFGGSMAAMRAGHLSEVIEFLKSDAAAKKQKLNYCLWAESLAPVNGPDAVTVVPYDADPATKLADPMMWMSAVLPLASSTTEEDTGCRGILWRGGLVNFKSVLASPFVFVPHEDIDVPAWGRMEVEDMVVLTLDAAKEKKGRVAPIRLEGFVDGLNRPVGQDAVDRAFARDRKRTSEVLTLRAERSGTQDVVEWLGKCLK